jgi:PST family polysaccharide transporter
MASSPEALRQSFREVIGLLGIIALPASFGMAAIAEPLVHTMLGDKWAEAVIFVQILALTGAFQAATSNHYTAWLALGKTGVVAFVGAVHIALLLPLMLVLSHFLGVVGIAYAELSASVASITLECVMLCRVLRVPLRSYLAGLWRSVIAATVMAVVVIMVRHELTDGHRVVGSLFQLAVAVPLGMVIYATTLLFLWIMAGRPRSAESLVLERAGQAASGLRRKLRQTTS